ncbi:MAG TPA: hypothetical protein VNE63_22200 [Candidatus Acidoferrales bacterium]|nr:hypothetical protein [Candidatus Acidoferrales bacterium]
MTQLSNDTMARLEALRKKLCGDGWGSTIPHEVAHIRAGAPPNIVSYSVGKILTTINGNVTKLANDLKKFHAQQEGKSWNIPANFTDDFVKLCGQRGVPITEIQVAEEPVAEAQVTLTDIPNPFDRQEFPEFDLQA